LDGDTLTTVAPCSTHGGRLGKRQDNQRRPVAIDLFAGVGGFSLGIEQAGFDVAVAVEEDPVHAAAYAFNFADTEVCCADITTLSVEAIRKAAREWIRVGWGGSGDDRIDLVIGGPPCQGFSIMGKRQPDDARNELVFEFCRLVKELQPRYFVMENVPGLGQKTHLPILKQLICEFQSAGYNITEPVKVLNAADFGVPQNRRRLFLLGSRMGETPLVYPQAVESGRVTVKEAIADLPNLDDFPELLKTDSLPLTDSQLRHMQATASRYVKKLRSLEADDDNLAYRRQWNQQIITGAMRTTHRITSIERFAIMHPGQLDPISRLRRLDWDKCCHTLRAGTGINRGSHTSPRPIHPQYPRVISVREAARLHSFPDWFRFHVTKWHGFRQVGNSVPPLLGRALGKQVMAALNVEPPTPSGFLELGDPQFLRWTRSPSAKYWQTKYPNTDNY
jgi:DNA (cytosine-5)-methyltransferase 1